MMAENLWCGQILAADPIRQSNELKTNPILTHRSDTAPKLASEFETTTRGHRLAATNFLGFERFFKVLNQRFFRRLY